MKHWPDMQTCGSCYFCLIYRYNSVMHPVRKGSFSGTERTVKLCQPSVRTACFIWVCCLSYYSVLFSQALKIRKLAFKTGNRSDAALMVLCADLSPSADVFHLMMPSVCKGMTGFWPRTPRRLSQGHSPRRMGGHAPAKCTSGLLVPVCSGEQPK